VESSENSYFPNILEMVARQTPFALDFRTLGNLSNMPSKDVG
jgi:hypothetical protein